MGENDNEFQTGKASEKDESSKNDEHFVSMEFSFY